MPVCQWAMPHGNCGCSTCHVHILQGFSSLEMEDDEDDILGKADDVQHHSRLGCQAFVNSEDLRVRITRVSLRSSMNIRNIEMRHLKSVIARRL